MKISNALELVVAFTKISKPADWLLPYILYVLIATILQLTITYLNKNYESLGHTSKTFMSEAFAGGASRTAWSVEYFDQT